MCQLGDTVTCETVRKTWRWKCLGPARKIAFPNALVVQFIMTCSFTQRFAFSFPAIARARRPLQPHPPPVGLAFKPRAPNRSLRLKGRLGAPSLRSFVPAAPLKHTALKISSSIVSSAGQLAAAVQLLIVVGLSKNDQPDRVRGLTAGALFPQAQHMASWVDILPASVTGHFTGL